MNAPGSPKAAATRSHAHGSGRGFLFGFGAYALWGVLPLYFKALANVGPVDIVAHRILWSVPVLALLITFTRAWPKVGSAFSRPRTVAFPAIWLALVLYVIAMLRTPSLPQAPE